MNIKIDDKCNKAIEIMHTNECNYGDNIRIRIFSSFSFFFYYKEVVVVVVLVTRDLKRAREKKMGVKPQFSKIDLFLFCFVI